MTERDASEQMDLDCAVAAVVGEAEGAESAVRAVKAEHIALALVRVSVVLAMDEEARRQKRSQPPRPPTLLLRRPSSALFHPPSSSSDRAKKATNFEASNNPFGETHHDSPVLDI